MKIIRILTLIIWLLSFTTSYGQSTYTVVNKTNNYVKINFRYSMPIASGTPINATLPPGDKYTYVINSTADFNSWVIRYELDAPSIYGFDTYDGALSLGYDNQCVNCQRKGTYDIELWEVINERRNAAATEARRLEEAKSPGLYRYKDGIYFWDTQKACHVVSPEQHKALATTIPNRLEGPVPFNPSYSQGNCLWPSGVYQPSGSGAVYFINDSKEICQVSTPDMHAELAKKYGVKPSASFEIISIGLTKKGTCSPTVYEKPTIGLYEYNKGIYLWDGQKACHVVSPEQHKALATTFQNWPERPIPFNQSYIQGNCLWPSGVYQPSGSGAVYFINDSKEICHIPTPDMHAKLAKGYGVKPSASFEIISIGLTYTGLCR